jgi:hypothetical protein
MSKITVTPDQDSGSASLSLTDKIFADIILNFLGNKEILKYEDNLNFILRMNDLEQFYYLINEKIVKEHPVSLDHFHVRISYSDKTNRELSGINQLNSYLETRDVLPIDVTLTWNILVQYPNASTVENQNIELSFFKINKRSGSDCSGRLLLTINHTNQAWGIEILNLIKDKIQEIAIPPHRAFKNATLLNSFFFSRDQGLLFTLIIIMSSLVLNTFFLQSISTKSEDFLEIGKIWNKYPDMPEVRQAIFAVENLSSDDLKLFASEYIKNPELRSTLIELATNSSKIEAKKSSFKPLFPGLIILLFLAFNFYLRKTIRYYEINSHILTSRRAETQMDNEKLSKGKLEYVSISALLITVFCGLATSAIYQLLQVLNL